MQGFLTSISQIRAQEFDFIELTYNIPIVYDFFSKPYFIDLLLLAISGIPIGLFKFENILDRLIKNMCDFKR
ncbi:MAG: hypothetical protein FD155_334 [Bacteroidetes bacterium]|nr:MAG: hypothetical protein FD155_334 [Bacteroidota bacterium]